MKELVSGNTIQAKDMLKNSTQAVLSTGDMLYTSPLYFEAGFQESSDNPFRLIVSPQGQSLLEENPQLLLGLLDDPTKGIGVWKRNVERVYPYQDGLRSVVAKERVRSKNRKFDVALKRVYDLDVTGIEQFQAMRALQEEGIPVAIPLLATKHRFVSEWINSPKAYDPSVKDRFKPYLQALKETANKLRDKGKWMQDWRVEEQPANYAIRDFKAKNPLEQFTAIDPIYRHSMFVTG
ncbi:MAG TPA: hypothetical protein VLF89_04205 [Candidatus Saccharimonadales bacterium]|nr:hypothetical protein [Candidatus Saccharimonadales bacterium]